MRLGVKFQCELIDLLCNISNASTLNLCAHGRRRAGGQASRRGHRTVAAAKGTRKRTTDDAIGGFIDNCLLSFVVLIITSFIYSPLSFIYKHIKAAVRTPTVVLQDSPRITKVGQHSGIGAP
ncbi:jg19878 [Pararge aegeria aegeria]|uniref:Jg19878 protein n=1 Tax=Pararge aegeria aegeria TaxID=348720 RepID=A0A8S4QDX3_9NEOP|nr:jg19878 [Pararge aegeria aegeria]